MKKSILIIIAAFVVVISLAGSTSAGCPDRSSLSSHTQTYDNLVPNTVTDGNVVTYILNTVAKDGASVIEYCVYPEPVFIGDNSNLTPLYVGSNGLWKIDRQPSKTFFGFERTHGDHNNIPVNGTIGIQIGKADYLSTDRLPTSEIILFHINDPEECGPTDDTCYRRPGTPPTPIPEISTIVLTSAGVLGLMLVSRKHRQK